MINTMALILSLRTTYEVPVSYQYTVQNGIPLLLGVSLYYESLSWLHLCCNGSCLLHGILVFGISAQVEQAVLQ